MTRFTTWTRWGLGALVVVSTGCSTSSNGSDATTPATPTTQDPAGDDPTTTAASTTAPATDAPTTIAPSTTAAAPSTTIAPSTTTASIGDGYPEQPAGVAWPTQEWPVGALPEGVSEAALADAVATAFGPADADGRVRSLVVVEGGEIVYERYHPLDSPDQATSSFSVAKSFTSATIGLLIGDGRLDLEAAAPVEEWQGEGDARAAITLEDLLRMSSGLEWTEDYSAGSIVLQMLQSPHAADVPIAQPLESEPGTVFEYSTGTTAILADIAADVLGGGDALDEYVHARLLEPLGISSMTLLEDSTGTWFGGLGADSIPRDFARFGLLFLRDGVWDGERVLPVGWVDASRSPSPTNPDYGLQWWNVGPPGSFAARGLFGQLIVIVPELDLVIVATATAGGDSDSLVNAVYGQFAAAVR